MRKDINRRNELDEEIDNILNKSDKMTLTNYNRNRKLRYTPIILTGFSVGVLIGAILYIPFSAAKRNDYLSESIESYENDYKEMMSSENEVKPIDFANYIVSSDNQDLALYALYDSFEDDYPKIIDETIKFIEFDYSGSNISNLTFDNYITINGFDSLDEYKDSVKMEIYDDYEHDREIELDNLNVKVKKLTLNNKEQ